MCISGIYAFTNLSLLTIENEVNTGAVNIELKEYTISDGSEILFDGGSEESVLPGQVISLIPRITNVGDSSYIRAKVSYTGESNITKEIADNNIQDVDADWVKHGDYWYYKSIVNPNDSVDLFRTLRIPSDVEDESKGKYIEFNVTAEAIQAENFNPDFNSDSPWGKTEIKKASNDSYKTDKIQMSSKAKIEYENNAEKYIEVPDNFLGKLSHVSPGDVISQEVTLGNTTSDEAEYFVTLKRGENMTEQQINLFKNLNLVVVADSKKLYEGNLYEVNKISLGKYDSKETAKVKFTVNVPRELDNEYSQINTLINWIFSVNGKDPVVPKPEPINNSPQTGDIKVQIAISAFMISAAGLIIILYVERRLNKKNK